MKARVLILALSILLPVTASAGLGEVRQAAEQGNVEKQLELGELYEFGFGLAQNQVPALTWYIVAAEHGNQKAAQRRDELQKHMTTQQIEQAQNQSKILLQATMAPTSVTQDVMPVSTSSNPSPAASSPPANPGSDGTVGADSNPTSTTSLAPSGSPPPAAN